MLDKNANIWMRAWFNALYPLGIYYVVISAMLFLARMIVGGDYHNYMIWSIFATAITLPVIYVGFFRPDHAFDEKRKITWGPLLAKTFLVILISMSVGFGLNILILLSPLPELSQGFADANQSFYGSSLWLELIGAGILTPLLEEVLYRGVIFGRVRRNQNFYVAAIVSAGLFAVMHFNVVQGLYAFLFGLVLCFLVEQGGHVGYAILGHMAANVFAVIRTETGFLAIDMLEFKMGIISGIVCLMIAVCLMLALVALGKKTR